MSDLVVTSAKPPVARTRARAWSAFAILMLALVVVFMSGITVLVRSDYRRSVSEAELQLAHFAELFEQSVEASLSVANLKMWNLIDRVGLVPLTNFETADKRFGDLMRSTVDEIRQIDSLVLIGADGTVVWSTAMPLVGRNLADRTYFQKAAQLSKGEYAVGIPIISRATGRRVTPVAWPLLSQNGTLRGVVASSLGESYFSKLLTLTGIPDDMQVDILTSNGEAAFLSHEVVRDPEEAVLVARQNVAALGLTVNVSRSRQAVLSAFRTRTIAFVSAAIILFFTAIGTAIRSHTQSLQLADGLKRSERDRKRILVAQREFDTIFDNVADGIVIFDKTGKLHRCNKKAREFLDIQDDAAAVAYLKSLLPPISDMDGNFSVHKLSLPHLSDEGHHHAIQCRVMKLETHGQKIAYCVLADVSAEERLSVARSSFVTSVNHELRTPLTSLAGSLDLLQDRFAKDLSPGAVKLVAMAQRNSDRLLLLVNDILTLQAIDQQQLNVRLEMVSVNDALDEAVATNSGYGLGTRVRLVRRPQETAQDACVLVDGARLQQIFSNLISNAIKYSPEGGEVVIGARVTEDTVIFMVQDHGPGIPGSAADQLFARFSKPIHARGIQASGTGLGLAITKELVERQEGEIAYRTRTVDDDSNDHGTTFYVSFKRHAAQEKRMEKAV